MERALAIVGMVAGVIVLLGVLIVASTLWVLFVIGTPFFVTYILWLGGRRALRVLTWSPAAESWLFWALTLPGAAATALVSFWLNAAWLLPPVLAKLKGPGAQQEASVSESLIGRITAFEMGQVTGPSTDLATFVIATVLYLPTFVFNVMLFQAATKSSGAWEVEGGAKFATACLLLTIGVHAGVFYSGAGATLSHAFSSVLDPGAYVVYAAAATLGVILVRNWLRGGRRG